MSCETEVHHDVGDGMTGGEGDSPSVDINATSAITPSTTFLDIVLIVPEQGVFPKVNPANDSRNKYEFNAASPGLLLNPDWESKVVAGNPSQFLQNTTYTSFTIAGTTRTTGSKTLTGDTIKQRFTYTTLPSSNNSFGDKEVIMTCTSPVSTTQISYVRVFFNKTADNHPLPDAPNHNSSPTPNWYYYWSQTPAFYGQVKYSNAGSGSGRTTFDSATSTWMALIESGAASQNLAGPWNNAKGIDFFANVCRHEEQHRLDMIAFWGPNSGRVAADDPDGDLIPTNRNGFIEADLTPAAHHVLWPQEEYNPSQASSVHDDVNYGSVGWRDIEDYAMHRQPPWTNGSVNEMDWAHPGKQWWLGGSEI
jgi:hypothetical protein